MYTMKCHVLRACMLSDAKMPNDLDAISSKHAERTVARKARRPQARSTYRCGKKSRENKMGKMGLELGVSWNSTNGRIGSLVLKH